MFFAVSISLEAWVGPIIIANESGKIYEDKTSVQFHPSGTVYVVSMAFDEASMRRDIYLYKYTGEKQLRGELVKKVSEGKKYVYEPSMVITADGAIHVAWAEADRAVSDEQYIMYRFLQNGEWSPVITIAKLFVPGVLDLAGFNKEKIDDLRLAVDGSGNVFVTFMTWPAARCRMFSKYGNVVKDEGFPMGGRSKHSYVVASDENVFLVWQQMLGAYTVCFAERKNIPNAPWTARDAKGGQHRPVMDLDQNGNPHLAFMADDQEKRSIIYKYWNGNKFSPRETLTEMVGLYQNVGIAVRNDKSMIVGSAVFKVKNTSLLYNWMKNGKWQAEGMLNVPGAAGVFDNNSVALSSNDIAAFAYNNSAFVYLILSEPLIVNEMPVAVLNVDKESLFWGETISMNSSGSHDPDGTIVKYEWKIIQDNVTLDGASVTYKFDKSYNNVRVRLTVIDDKGGRGIAEKVINVKALYTAVSTVSKQMVQTLIYNREGNVIKWLPNAKNAAAGYNIVNYIIFRKEAGGVYQQIGEVGAEKRAFADVTITAGKTYAYAVAAVDDQGQQSPYDNF